MRNKAERHADEKRRERAGPEVLATSYPKMIVAFSMSSAITFHATPVFPRGFRCTSRNVGLKPSARDLTLFASEVDATAAAVFTRNHFPGAPIILGRETIKGGVLRAIIANSKVSNVATGTRGVAPVRKSCQEIRAAHHLCRGQQPHPQAGGCGAGLPLAAFLGSE